MTIDDLKILKLRGEKIPLITAYDYSFARLAEMVGIDVILVGDSLGNVVLGHDTTIPVSMSDMVHHTRATARGIQKSLLIADMPFISYATPADAISNAAKLMQAGAHMVKLEGGEWLGETVHQLLQRGIPVCAHLGLTPQSVYKMGGFKVQGTDEESAENILTDAAVLEEAGASILVVECVPRSLGEKLSQRLEIPVIGIGAGINTDGQILVLHDVLGISEKEPSFSKNFMQEHNSIEKALSAYAQAVRNKTFPTLDHSFSN